MALVDCPECESRISDEALACPQCGYPISEGTRHSTGNVLKNEPEEEDLDSINREIEELERKLALEQISPTRTAYVENRTLKAPGLNIPVKEIRTLNLKTTKGG